MESTGSFKAIILKGHDRPITLLKFNKDGDLLFSASKSPQICVWYTSNGERLGTYSDHTGVVWSLDVTENSTRLISGSGDNSSKIWDVKTGECLATYEHERQVRWVAFSHGSKKFLTVTDNIMSHPAHIYIYTHSKILSPSGENHLVKITEDIKLKINQAHWGPLNEKIYTCNNDGSIRIYDSENGNLLTNIKAHKGDIPRMQFSVDYSCIITASKDTFAKIFDTREAKELKSYRTGRPVFAAALSPTMNHIMLSGGQSVESVTLTKHTAAQFKVRVFHKIYEEEIATLTGHFAPVWCVVFSNDGKMLATGAEDGYIRVHHLEDEYFEELSEEKCFKFLFNIELEDIIDEDEIITEEYDEEDEEEVEEDEDARSNNNNNNNNEN